MTEQIRIFDKNCLAIEVIDDFTEVDNLFFQRVSKGRQERYFDISQIDEAFDFINE